MKLVGAHLEEIQSLDIEKIVKHKTLQAFDLYKTPLIVDDSGISVHAWHGFPGPLVKFIDEAGGVDLFLKMLKPEQDRTITLTVCVGYHDGKYVHVFTGEKKATIAPSVRGTNGWSWDTVIIPFESKLTYAEMTDEEKNNTSHRGIAFAKLKEYLLSHPLEQI